VGEPNEPQSESDRRAAAADRLSEDPTGITVLHEADPIPEGIRESTADELAGQPS
jgi:hypothetical protein